MKRQRHWTYREEKVRAAVLRRDNWECQIRGEGCIGTANTVDHIHPKAWGGRATPDNLRAACWPCNQRKGTRADAAGDGSFFNRGAHSRARSAKYLPTTAWTPKVVDYSRKAGGS